MDILGSIMKTMVQPPRMAPEERERRKKAEEAQRKLKEAEQSAVLKFKKSLTQRIMEFSRDDLLTRLVLEPMTRQQRAIVHEIIENMEDLVAHSFGDEEVDRHVVIFKSGDCPSETELNCLKRGEVYTHNHNLTTFPEDVDATPTSGSGSRRKRKTQPEYLQKYEKHLRGLEVAKAGAKKTETSRSYGCVSSEQKKDKRTIEETLADIKARKKVKTGSPVTSATEASDQSQSQSQR